MGNTLESLIASSRMELQNGIVLYDLTNGLDIKHPKKLAKAISQVVFEQDISKWFRIGESDIECVPTHKLEIRLQKEHHREILKILKDLTKDIKYDEIQAHFREQIDAHVHSELQDNLVRTYFAGAAVAMAQDAAISTSLGRAFLSKLMSEVVANITVNAV